MRYHTGLSLIRPTVRVRPGCRSPRDLVPLLPATPGTQLFHVRRAHDARCPCASADAHQPRTKLSCRSWKHYTLDRLLYLERYTEVADGEAALVG